MDIVGKESLENILKEYNGTLIFVSHDRYFVNKIADSILAFEPEGVIYFKGNYEEYIQYKNSQNDKNIAEEKVIQTKKKNTNNQYLQNKEKLRRENKIKKLEAEIGQKELEIENLKSQMISEEICTDYIKLKELQDAITSIEQEIEAKMLEWEEYIEN